MLEETSSQLLTSEEAVASQLEGMENDRQSFALEPPLEIHNGHADSSDEHEKSQQADFSTTIAELLRNSDSNTPNSGSGQAGNLPFFTYNMTHFANLKHLDTLRTSYPSPYLLQTPHPSSPTTPSDVQIACEVVKQRYRAAITERSEPGILKVFAKMKEENPLWVLSEKRLRKVAKEAEIFDEADRILRLAGLIGGGEKNDILVPVSKMDWSLVNELEGERTEQITQTQDTQTTTKISMDEEKENQVPVPQATLNGNHASKKKSSKGERKGKSTASATSLLTESLSNTASTIINSLPEVVPAVVPDNKSTPLSSSGSSNKTNSLGDVSIHWYDSVKGRGVVAKRAFTKNSVIFREEAFAFAAAKSIQAAINDGMACGFCGKLFLGKASSLVVSCTSHEGLSSSSNQNNVGSVILNGGGVPQVQIRKVSGGRKVAPSPTKISKNKDKDKGMIVAAAGEALATGTSVVDKAATGEKEKKGKCSMKFCNKLCRDRCKSAIFSSLPFLTGNNA